MLNTLEKLVKIVSVSGHEKKLTEFISSEISPYVDSLRTDALGNLIATKKSANPDAKKVMFAAHADEIGFLATFIDDKGFIRVAPVGGIDWIASAFTTVTFENGTKGVLAAEANTKPEEYKQGKFYIDIGASSKEEAEKLVRIGDTAAITPYIEKFSTNCICGRPMDDKIACALLIEAIKQVKDSPYELYFVFSSQEEVGLRGSATASFGIAPDVGYAIDVTDTGDVPGSKPMAVSLGKGAAIKVKDSSVICDTAIVDKMCDLAEKKGIKYQLEILEYGGTDTASIQLAGSGAAVGAISVPTRYVHTACETIDLNDLDNCLNLITALCTEPGL